MPESESERARPRRRFDESGDAAAPEQKSRATQLVAGLVLMAGLAISMPLLSAKNVSSPAFVPTPVPITATVPAPTAASPLRQVQAVDEPTPAPAPLPRVVAGNSGLEPLREAEPVVAKNCDGCATSQAPQSYAQRRYAQPPPVVSPQDFSNLDLGGGAPAAPPSAPVVPPGVVQVHQPAQFKEMCDRLYLYKVANDTSKDWTNITVRADSGESWTAARLAAGQTMDVKTSQPTGGFDISGAEAP